MEMRGLIFGFIFAMFLGFIMTYGITQAALNTGQALPAGMVTTQYFNDTLMNISRNISVQQKGLDTAAQTSPNLDPSNFIGSFIGAGFNNLKVFMGMLTMMVSLIVMIPEYFGLPSFIGTFGILAISVAFIYAMVSFLRGMKAE